MLSLVYMLMDRMAYCINKINFQTFIKIELPETTVEPQWLEQLWNHENMFETGILRANEY